MLSVFYHILMELASLSSICPSAGKTTVDTTTNAPYAWKLPPSTGDGSYTNLFLTKAQLVTTTNGTNPTFANTIQAEPYGFALAGYYSSNPSYQGQISRLWTRVSNEIEGNSARDFYFWSATSGYHGLFDLQIASGKYNGRAVRCGLFLCLQQAYHYKK